MIIGLLNHHGYYSADVLKHRARTGGPSIPVAGALGDPTLELHDGSGTLIAVNDNWKTRPDGSSRQAEIEATAIPPTNDLESALVRTLQLGSYTVIVRGKNNTTEIGLRGLPPAVVGNGSPRSATLVTVGSCYEVEPILDDGCTVFVGGAIAKEDRGRTLGM